MAAPSINCFTRSLRPQFRSQYQGLNRLQNRSTPRECRVRAAFHVSSRLAAVKPYLLADIGEGITECQIIQWFVQPGARVAQFDKICEVQSDKAAVEITSRFDGVIKKLHYEADDMAQVGKPLVDIDIQGEIAPEDEALTQGQDAVKGEQSTVQASTSQSQEPVQSQPEEEVEVIEMGRRASISFPLPSNEPSGKHKSLATPAVRHMIKELGLQIEDISGSGRDGRVLKEDVQRHTTAAKSSQQSFVSGKSSQTTTTLSAAEDQVSPFSPVQRKMYETMTKSLSIPHFLYSDHVDFTSLGRVRRALNTHPSPVDKFNTPPKLSALPFIVKAVSLALAQYPSLNAHLDTSASKPLFTHKGAHNIGIAMDTPQGLLVPVIKNVESRSIHDIAAEVARLAELARNNKLGSADLSGATFSISNIGSLGGSVVAPVIVSPQVAILGVGRARAVPAFNETGEVVRKEEAVFSWSADHRVVDGATVARCAEAVRSYLEGTERMLVNLK